jgi:hypothetical protein
MRLGGMTPSWTRAFQSCQDDRWTFRLPTAQSVGHWSRAPCAPSTSAPRQLPRIVASSPGTRVHLAGERLERADESSLSSGHIRTCRLRRNIKVLWRERGVRPRPSSDPATSVASVATRPSVVTTPTSTAAPYATSPDTHHYYTPTHLMLRLLLYDRSVVRSTHLTQQALRDVMILDRLLITCFGLIT